MNKIWIVFRSEFLRRVRSKWFILTTLLGPVVLLFLVVIPPVIGMMASDSAERVVAVVDETGVLAPRLTAAIESGFTFASVDAPADSVMAAVEQGTYDGYLLLPAGIFEGSATARYYSVEGGGVTMESRSRASSATLLRSTGSGPATSRLRSGPSSSRGRRLSC